LLEENAHNFEAYQVGDTDDRPWGSYKVINIGMEGNDQVCEKQITIQPLKALSLQRHHLRSEYWRVEEGLLTAIIDDEKKLLGKKNEIYIPKKAAHCMVNLTNEPVIVYEKQIGLCYEADNERLCDANDRETLAIAADDHDALAAKKIYEHIIQFLRNTEKFYTQEAA